MLCSANVGFRPVNCRLFCYSGDLKRFRIGLIKVIQYKIEFFGFAMNDQPGFWISAIMLSTVDSGIIPPSFKIVLHFVLILALKIPFMARSDFHIISMTISVTLKDNTSQKVSQDIKMSIS